MRFLIWCISCGLAFMIHSVSAQVVIPDSTVNFHNQIIKTAMSRIDKLHFSPRPLDSVYSERLWNNYINQLDPEHAIFLQKDITNFSPFKYILGHELNEGSSSFFNLVYSRYCERIGDVKRIFDAVISAPIDFSKKGTFILDRKNLPFPGDDIKWKETWEQVVKLAVLKHYMEGDSILSERSRNADQLNADLERSSIDFVKRWYTDYFRNAIQGNALNDKFALYLNTAMSEIDPHTAYVAPLDKSFEALITKKFFGIGVELGQKGADLYIKRILQGGPAYNSGKIRENDVIVAVENAKGVLQQVGGLAPTEVANLIRGEKGTSVNIQLAQPGEAARTVKLERGEVIDTHNKAKSAIIEKDGKKIGFINLPLFYLDPKNDGKGGAGFDVAMEVMKLNENQVDGIIVDLRNNLGGSLPDVVKMCGIFLPVEPAITYLKDKDTINGMGFSQKGLVNYEGPLVVMVNENSASASEIFSAAMQDFHRALIIGTSSTFGKGTAQTVLNMGKLGDPENGIPNIKYGSMRLTEKKFYRVTGVSTQLVGVKPDIVLIDKMLVNAPMEKMYTSALKSDTIILPAYQPLIPGYNYKAVIDNANNRIRSNSSFKTISSDLDVIRTLSKAPQELNFTGFKNQYLKLKSANEKVKMAATLPEDKSITVVGAKYQSIRPDLINMDPNDLKDYSGWMDGLSKDVYLKETLNIVLDVINYSNNK